MRRRIEMRRTLLTLAAGSLTLASGITASAAQQAPSDPTMQQNRPGMMMPQQGGAAGQQGSPPDSRAPGMMGRGDGPGMMCRMMGRSDGPGMMRMMFIMMDANGDGTLSQEEFQAVHNRIFNYEIGRASGRERGCQSV